MLTKVTSTELQWTVQVQPYLRNELMTITAAWRLAVVENARTRLRDTQAALHVLQRIALSTG